MDENVIRSEIEQAVAQVDPTLTVDEVITTYDSTHRALTVRFTAKSASGEALEVSNTW